MPSARVPRRGCSKFMKYLCQLAFLLASMLCVPHAPVYAQVTGSPRLLLDESGPTADQVAALESVLFLRDPFSVRRVSQLLSLGPDPNTRGTIFVANLQPGQAPVVVNLSDNDNQTYGRRPSLTSCAPLTGRGFFYPRAGGASSAA
jgi:hypothetical protein